MSSKSSKSASSAQKVSLKVLSRILTNMEHIMLVLQNLQLKLKLNPKHQKQVKARKRKKQLQEKQTQVKAQKKRVYNKKKTRHNR